jgi:hypothetical protein
VDTFFADFLFARFQFDWSRSSPKEHLKLIEFSRPFCGALSGANFQHWCQGCQMVFLIPKNPNLGKFLMPWNGGRLVYFVVIWLIFWSFGLFCGHLEYFVGIWYIYHVLVCCTNTNLATLAGPNPTT